MRLRTVAILCLAVVTGCMTAVEKRAQDTRGMAQKTARGTVTAKKHTPGQTKVFTSQGRYGPMSMPITIPPKFLVTFSFDGMTQTLDGKGMYERFAQGQDVTIAYTRGRSGKVYIDSVNPAGPAKTVPRMRTVVFDEDFDDNTNRWAVGSSGGGSTMVRMAGGKYEIRRTKKSPWGAMLPRNVFDRNKDFVIEAEMTKTEGVETYPFGLMWGVKDGKNNYSFWISGNGKYRIVKYERGKMTDLKPWTFTPHINQGGAANTLAIAREGGQTSFFVNNKCLTEIPSPTLFGDKIAIEVSGKMTIAVEYVKVSADGPYRSGARAAAPAKADDKAAKLKALLAEGIITQEEYNRKMAGLRGAPASPRKDLARKIAELKKLKSAGLLTEEEYRKKKDALISEYLRTQ